MDRRTFLENSTATGMVASVATMLPKGWAAAAEANVPWYRTVKRVGQTNFNERDPGVGSVEAWADYWASAKVQAVALSVSGLVAFYPTEVPFFHQTAHLKGRDLFGECFSAAKRRGLRVFGRMSPDILYVDPELLAARPQWFRRTEKGELLSPAPGVAFTCQFGGRFTEQQPAILRELLARYDLDGLYMNGWPTMQTCHCDTCRKLGGPASDAYEAALMDDAVRLIDLYSGIVTSGRSDRFYSCNFAASMEHGGLDQWQLTRKAMWYTSDNQSRSSMAAPVWQASQEIKFARSLMGDRPVAMPTASYAISRPAAWRQATEMTQEPITRMAQTAAAGGVMWCHQLGLEQGQRQDRRWQAPSRDFLSWHAENEVHFDNVRSLANVAIVVPTKTMAHRREMRGRSSDYLQGMYAVLMESRVPVDLVHENDLNADRLAPYDLLILPNFALMSDVQARTLELFAQRGGSLLATYQTGLFSEEGAPRTDYALGKLFGIAPGEDTKRWREDIPPYITPTYLQKVRKRESLTTGFEETTWIAGPMATLPVVATGDVPLTYIDPYPFYPPETVYQRTSPSDRPSVVTRELGNTRLAYFAGDTDASYWRFDNADLGRLLINTVRWLLNGRMPVEVAGEGLMEVIAWETKRGYAVHMLNFHDPNAHRGHMREPLALGPQRVSLTLDAGVRISAAKLLCAGGSIVFRQNGRSIEAIVPRIPMYEVIAFEI